MIQEDKNLLIADLCARLPYGVMCDRGGRARKLLSVSPDKKYCIELANDEYVPNEYRIEDVRPYLRPLSSITEKEMRELYDIPRAVDKENVGYWHKFSFANHKFIDYLNRHHLDYRGLIPLGLALEAKEGMYEIK